MKTISGIISILLIGCIFSCKKENVIIEHSYRYTTPLVFNDGLETGTLSSVGLDSVPIIKMMDYLNSDSSHTIHNILILKNSKLVFEEYFKGYKINYTAANLNGELMDYSRTTDHPMHSVSKSVTSVIFGIAVKNGYITNLNKKIIDYFPEYADLLTGDKANITIHHLLTMTCGLAFDEQAYPYSDARNELRQAMNIDDPIRYILSKPVVSVPGTQFHYSSGSGLVLAAILEKVTGKKFLDYANEKLFDPLRSEGGVWTSSHSGLTLASSGLYFRARELTKIGLLFLNNGQWEGKQIITPEWIELSQQEFINTNNAFYLNSSYGYQWWITGFTVNGVSHKCFFAVGWGNQFMYIIPDLNMIIEFNCGNYEDLSRTPPIDLVNDYILRAIKE